MEKLILGSQSPRRKEILGYFTYPFVQVSPDFNEEAVPFKGDPKEYVATLSKGKAQSLANRFPNDLILTADTVVYRSGKIFNKPKDASEAKQMFLQLLGRWHTVYTGVTLQKEEQLMSQVETTRVLFNRLTDEQMEFLLAKNEWVDKAGGYAIQQGSGLIVKKIDGCYYNAMGLPVNTVAQLLRQFGVELSKYL